jgi:hypothetical protein
MLAGRLEYRERARHVVRYLATAEAKLTVTGRA